MTDDSLLDTPVPPSTQALSARLTLAALDGAPDRVQAGLLEAIADPNTAIAVIGLLTNHLAITLVAATVRSGPRRCCRRSSWTPVRPTNDHSPAIGEA